MDITPLTSENQRGTNHHRGPSSQETQREILNRRECVYVNVKSSRLTFLDISSTFLFFFFNRFQFGLREVPAQRFVPEQHDLK